MNCDMRDDFDDDGFDDNTNYDGDDNDNRNGDREGVHTCSRFVPNVQVLVHAWTDLPSVFVSYYCQDRG